MRGCADCIDNVRVRSNSPLRIDWLLAENASGAQPLIEAPGRVALSSCPGRSDVSGDVEEDIAWIQSRGIGTVVSLVSDAEMALYGVLGLRTALRMAGLRSVQYAIEDKQAPGDLKATLLLCRSLLRSLGEGENVLLHCIGGWGRSGTIAACLLAHQGYDAETAVNLVRQARSPYCVETNRQFAFVRRYTQALLDAQTGSHRYYCIVPRSELATKVSGEPAARCLQESSADALLSAAAVSEQMWSRLAGGEGAGRESQFVVLSGERSRDGSDPVPFPLDRALAYDGRRWRALPFAQLLTQSAQAAD